MLRIYCIAHERPDHRPVVTVYPAAQARRIPAVISPTTLCAINVECVNEGMLTQNCQPVNHDKTFR